MITNTAEKKVNLIDIVNDLNKGIAKRWKELGVGQKYKECQDNYEMYGGIAPADRPKDSFVFGYWVTDHGSDRGWGPDHYSGARFEVYWAYKDLIHEILPTMWSLFDRGLKSYPNIQDLHAGWVDESAIQRLTTEEQDRRIKELKLISGLNPYGDVHLFVYRLQVVTYPGEKQVGSFDLTIPHSDRVLDFPLPPRFDVVENS